MKIDLFKILAWNFQGSLIRLLYFIWTNYFEMSQIIFSDIDSDMPGLNISLLFPTQMD